MDWRRTTMLSTDRLGILAVLALLAGHARLLDAEPQPVPVRIAQSVPGEPPLAGSNDGACPVEPPPASVAAPPGVAPFSPAPLPAGEPIDPAVPTVALRVRVPATGTAGRNLDYRIVVDNLAQASAHHVIVRVPIPANARYVRANPAPAQETPEVQWRLGTLEPRGRRELSLVLIPTGTGDVRLCARVQFEHGQCVTTRLGGAASPVPTQPPPAAAPATASLRLRKEGPNQAIRFDALTYRLEVLNAGAAPANDVVLTDTLPDGLEFSTSNPSTAGDNPLVWKLGTIGPGQSKRVEYQAFAKKTGELTNRASVTWAGGQRQEASQTVVINEARMTALMSGPVRRIVNRPASYQITVTNAGTSPLTGLKISNKIPADIAFVSASDGGQLVGDYVQWSLPSLAPGGKWVVQLVVRARKAGELINLATITADRGLSAQAETKTSFEGATGLTVEIDKSEDPLEVGRQSIYTVRILNQGSAAATNIGLTVVLPDLVKITAANDPSRRPPRQDMQRLVFAPVATLAGGAEATFTVTVQGQTPGAGRLRVEVAADQFTPGNPLKQEESVTVFGNAAGR